MSRLCMSSWPHDLSVGRHVRTDHRHVTSAISWRSLPGEELYHKPIHPYTTELLGAIPIPTPLDNRDAARPICPASSRLPRRSALGRRFATPDAARARPESVSPRSNHTAHNRHTVGHLAAWHQTPKDVHRRRDSKRRPSRLTPAQLRSWRPARRNDRRRNVSGFKHKRSRSPWPASGPARTGRLNGRRAGLASKSATSRQRPDREHEPRDTSVPRDLPAPRRRLAGLHDEWPDSALRLRDRGLRVSVPELR